jgi:hypothetical protein
LTPSLCCIHTSFSFHIKESREKWGTANGHPFNGLRSSSETSRALDPGIDPITPCNDSVVYSGIASEQQPITGMRAPHSQTGMTFDCSATSNGINSFHSPLSLMRCNARNILDAEWGAITLQASPKSRESHRSNCHLASLYMYLSFLYMYHLDRLRRGVSHLLVPYTAYTPYSKPPSCTTKLVPKDDC